MTATLPGPDGEVTGAELSGSGGVENSAPVAAEPAQAPEPELLLEPRDGVPAVIESQEALDEVIARFAAGTGPVAVDAERASGYRYSQRAYLVQLRRAGAGTALIDPIACPDLSGLSAALEGVEWVLHAASQDLACLAEVGFVPSAVFDTELGGRLAGFERVGLGAMVESVLGLRLEKGHSAADWSTRPLPHDWLVYAALDVEVLVELRDRIEAVLAAQGKLAWAHEEFEAVRLAPTAPPRVDPWRRTSGIHRLRSPRELAAVRAMWELRDDLARRRDTAPGRVLPDAAIVNAVTSAPTSQAELVALPVFGGRSTRRHAAAWFGALQEAARLGEEDLPQPVPGGDSPPAPNRWAERDPVAARRLARVRAAVTAVAEQVNIPAENVVQPEAVRRLAWNPPEESTPAAVADHLRGNGARPWQLKLVSEALAAVLPDPPPGTNGAQSSRGAAKSARAGAKVRDQAPDPAPSASGDGAPRVEEPVAAAAPALPPTLGPPPFSDS